MKRYRYDIIIFSLYGILPIITNKRSKNVLNRHPNNNSPCEYDMKRPQTTSNDLRGPKMSSEETNENDDKVKTRNKLGGGDPNDDNPINGRDLIEQSFSS